MTANQIVFDVSEITQKVRRFQSFAESAQTRVLTKAVTAGCRVVQRRIQDTVPFNTRKKRKQALHYRDTIAFVTREYGGARVVGVVGHESKMAPHAHLIEKGTAQRFTNSKPSYKRMAVGVKFRMKRGKLVQVSERERVSTGSRMKKKGKPRLNRGRMPAFRTVENALNSSYFDVTRAMSASLDKSLKAEFTEALMRRGQ